jgi:hypothetical protein
MKKTMRFLSIVHLSAQMVIGASASAILKSKMVLK